ncbi:MAG: hypothetical protein MMC33_006137 [Icmadophila ericetorum]|nr:hypothetical protein [Icmadophila ericetorum]
MQFSLVLTTSLCLLPFLSAAPLSTRAEGLDLDIQVLQLGLYLEHLEFNFFTLGYQNFTDSDYTKAGFASGFRDTIKVIADQEADHIATITNALNSIGITPVPACAYWFPFNSTETFVSLANMITSVGIGAYIGASENLINSSPLLNSALSILTVEARHDAFLRLGLGASPFPEPYDTALTGIFAYNLAKAFVPWCPTSAALSDWLPPVLPTLTLLGPAPPITLQPAVSAGTPLKFSWDPTTFLYEVKPSTQLYIMLFNQIADQTPLAIKLAGNNTGTVPIPVGFGGAVFAVLGVPAGLNKLANSTDFTVLAGPALVVLS